MIVDILFIAVKAVMTPIFSVLPTFSLVSTLGIPGGSFSGGGVSIGSEVGNFFASFDGILPLHEMVAMIRACMIAMFAFFAIYKFGNWVWRHIPDLWGFGPGSG